MPFRVQSTCPLWLVRAPAAAACLIFGWALNPGVAQGADAADPSIPRDSDPAGASSTSTAAGPEMEGQRIDWGRVLWQSGVFLGISHGFRFATEPGTRQEMRGPFLRDWFRSVKGVRGWGDGDPFIVNYVGHPYEGAVASYILIQNDPAGRAREFGVSNSGYWKSRIRGMGWAAVYSTQFEIGPLSEASFGNVGMKSAYGAGFVDLVTTPVAGFGMTVLEDAVDRYVVRWVETRTNNRVVKMLARGVLNPSRTFANVMGFRVPWARDTRPGIFSKR